MIHLSCSRHTLIIVDLQAIAKAVANCPTITHLNLQNNGISDPGAVALAETIGAHPNIVVLELGHLSTEGRGVEQNALWSDGCDSNSCLGRFSELLVRVFSPICSTAHAVYVPEVRASHKWTSCAECGQLVGERNEEQHWGGRCHCVGKCRVPEQSDDATRFIGKSYRRSRVSPGT